MQRRRYSNALSSHDVPVQEPNLQSSCSASFSSLSGTDVQVYSAHYLIAKKMTKKGLDSLGNKFG